MVFGQSAVKFHNQADAEIMFRPQRSITTTETKYIVVQERELSYRLYPHFHPYVGRLARKLLRDGTPGLQGADTEYVSERTSLPGSVEIAIASQASLTAPQGASVSLVADVQATTPGGAITLSATMQLELASAAQAVLPGGLHATLLDGLTQTPDEGEAFVLTQNRQAVVFGDTVMVLSAVSGVTLHDGTAGTVPAGTHVLLARGTQVTVPAGTSVTLLRSALQPVLYEGIFSPAKYNPSLLVAPPYPVKDLDFTTGGAYSVYNWELFFHVPLTIAIHLSRNQRFADAQRWFHYLFDPTDTSDGPTPDRFWKVRPFHTTDVKKVEEILVNLATGADETLRKDTIRSIGAWQSAPFRPHVIARYRQQAYMYKTVMAYLDNLIAWGDSLFRQDTGETIDEAMMLYVLAANILGPRPQMVPKKGSVRPQHYDNLRKDLAQFGTVTREIEADIGFDLLPAPAEDSNGGDGLATVRSLGRALYFCVPRNDKLLSYWDTVADRLFKIRNSLNLQGVFRQLALFEPPIDPAMLARAAAAGLDVGAIVNGLNQPLPLVRFQVLAQKAGEIAQEVKSLGGSLLAAMEKEDGEAMAILRARHERAILGMVEHVKYGQLQEAIKNREALLRSLAAAVARYAYYEQHLGRKADEIEKGLPELGELDAESLAKMKFSMKEPEMTPREIEVDIATDVAAQAAQALYGGKLMSSHETRESLLLEGAQLSSDVANVLSLAGSVAHLFPTAKVHAQPMGVGGTVEYGGKNVGDGLNAVAAGARAIAERLNFEARRAARIDAFARRERDWAFQSNVAAADITVIFKQLRAAQIREAIAERELAAHRRQMKHADDLTAFLNEDGTVKTGKKTNKALYTWMKREVKALYAQAFQFAFDTAKKAERALQHELGRPDLSSLQFTYLAGKEGLLAGEKLYLDVKRMEMAYHDLNQRQYELTKHVSLLQADPMALVRLRRTGRCTVTFNESLFDMDGPGHYFRRIKSVALTVPSVTGPYTSLNCTLTLLRSAIRKVPTLRDGIYAREGAEDDRFADYFGSLQSIVTSSAQQDGGLFETNLRDERYLPFEHSGVISEWQLELAANPLKGDPQQFDYGTIADVIWHIRYTAREGGALLRRGALDQLQAGFDEAQGLGSVRLFSARHEFPVEWARFQGQAPDPDQRFELTFSLAPQHYPFWSQGRLESVTGVEVLVRSSLGQVPASLDVFDRAARNDPATLKVTLAKDPTLGNLLAGRITGEGNGIALPSPTGPMRLFFDEKTVADVWVAVTWSSS